MIAVTRIFVIEHEHSFDQLIHSANRSCSLFDQFFAYEKAVSTGMIVGFNYQSLPLSIYGATNYRNL